MTEVFAFLAKGGWFMLPILLLSVVGLAFFLERLWQLQREKILPPRFLEVVGRLLETRRFKDAEDLCNQNESPVAAVLTSGLRYAGRQRDLIKEVMEETGRRELYFMERFTGALGAIATVSPLLGLLGTVVGMISMFQQVVADADKAGVDVGLLANGIWQALITTAAGLLVAIPIFLGYRYLLGRIDRFAVEIEDVALRALDYLSDHGDGPTADLHQPLPPGQRQASTATLDEPPPRAVASDDEADDRTSVTEAAG